MCDNPCRWHHPPPFIGLVRVLIWGSSPAEVISPNENVDEVETYIVRRKEELEERARKQEEAKKEQEARTKLIEQEMEKAQAEADIASTQKRLGISVDSANPLKPILYPAQQILREVICYVRIGRSILCWDEPIYAFWVVFVAFAASFVCLFIPWAFIIRWLLRIVVWILLGPWMALVDRFYFRKQHSDQEMSDTEESDMIRKELKARARAVLESTSHFRLVQEQAKKLKDMTRFCFGKHLVRVPRFREELFTDYALPISSSEMYDAENAPNVRVAERFFGQSLRGDMVPKREITLFEESKQRSTASKKKGKWGRIAGKMAVFSKMKDTDDDGQDEGKEEKQPLLKKVFHKLPRYTPDKPKETNRAAV